MNKTKIEWVKNPDGTQGYTWNPITGCLNGCEYCYAYKLANGRLKSRYLANKNWDTHTPKGYEGYPNLDPFYPRFWSDRCNRSDILTGGKPKGIFVCDMSDLFGIGIPEDWTHRVMDRIQEFPLHRFYLLTKQPQNLIKFSPFPDTCWVGVSVTNLHQLHHGLHGLAWAGARVRFLSFEPLLERVFREGKPWIVDQGEQRLSDVQMLQLSGINWVIIGAQTKPAVYPKDQWVREIEDACDKAGIPVFEKNNLYPKGFSHLLRQEMPSATR